MASRKAGENQEHWKPVWLQQNVKKSVGEEGDPLEGHCKIPMRGWRLGKMFILPQFGESIKSSRRQGKRKNRNILSHRSAS